MKDFLSLIRRFIPPYKKYVGFNIFLNILSAILNLVSFALIIPILNILFELNETEYVYMDWVFSPGSWEAWKETPELIKNNFYWYVSDLIETHGGSVTLIILGTFLVVMTFLKVASMYGGFFTMIPIRTGVVRDIRNQINRKITQLPLEFFSEERKGDIIARVSGDVNEVETSIMSSLDMLFKNPILIFVYLTGMFLISWQLTLFVLVLLPIAGYFMGLIGRKLKRKSLEGQQQWGLLMSQIEETLGGLRIIKAFNAEDKMQDRFEQTNETFRNITNRIYRRQQMAHPMSEFLGTIAVAVVLWYGGTLILSTNSPIDASTFIYYLVIFYSIISPAKDLSKATYSIQKGLASMQRIDKILLAESSIIDAEKPKFISLSDKIAYKNIWFKYKENWVIKGVNLEIPRGKTIALVGQSGSGKSTMADLLPRFYDIQKGGISIDGADIRDAKVHDVRELMGIVNQEAILFNDSFFNNIAFGVKNATMEAVQEAAKIANAHEFITASEDGYHTNIGDRGGKLSGGQRQRISIARAVLKNPPILILDEATSALDTESERLVQEALEKLMINRTTLVVAHRLSTIKNADMICVMHEGQIVERGTHSALFSLNGYYTKLCEMQSF